MNLIGQEVKGFYYDPLIFGPKSIRNPLMDEHIGQIGTIIGVNQNYKNNIIIQFNNGKWIYPKHLIFENLVDPLSMISKLTGYITIEVSNDNKNWCRAEIIVQLSNGDYLTTDLVKWKFGRKIEI
jgi:hypothetical protein